MEYEYLNLKLKEEEEEELKFKFKRFLNLMLFFLGGELNGAAIFMLIKWIQTE